MLRDEVWQLVEESRSSGKVLPSTQCHLPHPNTQRREGYKSKEFQTHSTLQCDLQNHLQGHSSKTQANPPLHHFQGAIWVRRRKENHG
jgi:hypothetical protein